MANPRKDDWGREAAKQLVFSGLAKRLVVFLEDQSWVVCLRADLRPSDASVSYGRGQDCRIGFALLDEGFELVELLLGDSFQSFHGFGT